MHTRPSYVQKKKETTPTTDKSSPCAEASCPRSKLPAAGCRRRSSQPSCAGRRPRPRPAGRWRTICCGTAHGWTWCQLSTWAAAQRWAPPPDRPNTGQRKWAQVRAVPSPVGEAASVAVKLFSLISHTLRQTHHCHFQHTGCFPIPHHCKHIFPFSYVLPQGVRVRFPHCRFSVFNTQRVCLCAFSLAGMI